MSLVSIDLPYNVDGFLPDSMVVWLGENVGEVVNSHKSCAVGVDWHLASVRNLGGNIVERYTFSFYSQDAALLFKLTWGGE